MTDKIWQRISAILDELFELPPDERLEAWRKHPEPDPAIREEVSSLLSASNSAEGYLESPAFASRKPKLASTIGPWQLVEEIGEGGMSVVYRGERVSGGYKQRVAIKLIALPALLTEAMARQIRLRFEAERQIVAHLEHPNICKLLDGGITDDGFPYLVLEYIKGQDLLAYSQPLPLDSRLALFSSVALAVHYAHQRLIVHRDIKPSNVIVGPGGQPKLLDFGIAKSLDPTGLEQASEQTSTLFLSATPAYASPEQLSGQTLTTATDVYSLGVLLSKIAAPFSSPDLSAIISRATREEAKDRYLSAADFAADIDRLRQGRPVEARQWNFQYLFAKLVRRHAAVFAFTALLAVLLIATFTLTIFKNREISRERERATAVANFLRGLFQASDPEINQGNRFTTRELLDQGAQTIRSASLDTETRLDLTETMADAYAGLGLYEKSIALYQSIIDTDSSRPSSRRLAHSLAGLSSAHAHLGRYPVAESAAVRAVAVAKEIRPLDPVAEASALEQQCLTLLQSAKYAPAPPLCGAAVEKGRAAKLPPLVQARLLRSHGRSLKSSSDFAGAEKALLQALELVRASGSELNSTHAVVLDELGGIYFRQGRFEDATRYFTQSIALSRKLYPDGHVIIARSLNNLANTQSTLRRFDEAEKLYRDAHTHYRRFLGPDSGELASSLSNLAVTQQGAYRLTEAALTLEQVVDMHARNTGRNRLPYLSATLKYANLRLEQDRPSDALRLAAEVVEGLDRLEPPPPIERGFARVVLAAALIESGRAREALPVAQSAQRILNPALAPKHWMRSYSDAALAAGLAGSGERDNAKKLLQPLVAELPKALPSRSWRAAWMQKLWHRYFVTNPKT
jgi:serine/threonine protein kinase